MMLPLPLALPAPTTFSFCITGLQCANLLAGFNEVKAPTQYSKFASALPPLAVTGRTGMLIIYMPSLLVGVSGFLGAPMVNGREVIIAAMIVLHFAKRVAETLFVHRYSNSMSGGISGFIGVFYALICALIMTQQSTVAHSLYEGAVSDAILLVGLALFGIGQAGNAFHHVLLAQLRASPDIPDQIEKTPLQAHITMTSSKESSKASSRACAYKLPTGGLFESVTMPHYLFEVIAWVGLALCTQQLNALLVAGGMASYLAGRAKATTEWYRRKFDSKAVPLDRKHMIPFLF